MNPAWLESKHGPNGHLAYPPPTCYVCGVKSLRVGVPFALKEEVRRWAAEHGRSISAEVIAIIEQEAQRRKFELELDERLRRYGSNLGTDT
jgi:hypothetical protein